VAFGRSGGRDRSIALIVAVHVDMVAGTEAIARFSITVAFVGVPGTTVHSPLHNSAWPPGTAAVSVIVCEPDSRSYFALQVEVQPVIGFDESNPYASQRVSVACASGAVISPSQSSISAIRASFSNSGAKRLTMGSGSRTRLPSAIRPKWTRSL
jgi:hypothetical protein